jgi:hypothetical protein
MAVELPVVVNEEEGAVVVVPALPQRFPFASKIIKEITYPPETVSVTAVVSVDEKSPYSITIPGHK